MKTKLHLFSIVLAVVFLLGTTTAYGVPTPKTLPREGKGYRVATIGEAMPYLAEGREEWYAEAQYFAIPIFANTLCFVPYYDKSSSSGYSYIWINLANFDLTDVAPRGTHPTVYFDYQGTDYPQRAHFRASEWWYGFIAVPDI